MTERVFAAVVIAICVVLLARLLMGDRRRYRFDAAAQRTWQSIVRAWRSTSRWVLSFRQRRESNRHAAEMTRDAIRRASRRADWDGNVNTPKSFRKPPHDKMH